MMKAILASLTMAFGINASANSVCDTLLMKSVEALQIQAQVGTLGLNWKVGDTANYSLNMSIIQGTVVMKVASIGADGMWVHQDMDMGFAGQQQVQMLIDPANGAVKKVLVNGQEQELPEQDIEVISTEETQITVPAGTFPAFHVIAKDNKTNEQIQMWVNMQQIPLFGLLKQIAPSQLGEVTMELTSFVKN